MNGVLFHQDNASAHKSGCNGCCVWLWLWMGWSPSISPWFGTIWPFSVPQHEKTCGWEAVVDWWWGHICSWGLFRGSGWMLIKTIPRESKCCNTDGRRVWTAGETMLKNKPDLVKFDDCILAYNFSAILILPPPLWSRTLHGSGIYYTIAACSLHVACSDMGKFILKCSLYKW